MATRCESAPPLRPLKWREECPGLVPCAAPGFPHSASARLTRHRGWAEIKYQQQVSTKEQKRRGAFQELEQDLCPHVIRVGAELLSVVICPGEQPLVRGVTTHTNTKFVSFFQATILPGGKSQTPNHCRFTDSLKKNPLFPHPFLPLSFLLSIHEGFLLILFHLLTQNSFTLSSRVGSEDPLTTAMHWLCLAL